MNRVEIQKSSSWSLGERERERDRETERSERESTTEVMTWRALWNFSLFFKFIIHNTDKNSSSFSFAFFSLRVCVRARARVCHNRKIEIERGRWISVHSLQLIKNKGST